MLMIERVSRRRRARRGWRTSRPCWVSGMRRNRGSGVARRFGFPVRGEAEDPVVSVQHRCLGVGRARSPACAAAPDRHYPHAGVDRKLARHVERGTARIRSATVSHRAGRWWVSFSVEITRHDPGPARPGSVVGVDLGVKSLAVLSTGEVIPNPRHLEVAQRELRRLQRQAASRIGPDRRTRQVPSARWRKTRPASPVCTLLSRTRAATACTNSPPDWYTATTRL